MSVWVFVICESWRPYDEMELKSVPVPGPLAPGEVRIGGFGGADGLADWLRAHAVDVLARPKDLRAPSKR